MVPARDDLNCDAASGLDRRTLIALAGAGVTTALMPAGATTLRRDKPDLTVSLRSGPGHYPTLTAAIDAARARNRPTTILLTKGVWREKPVVDVPDLTIVGEGPDSVLVHGTAAGHRMPDGSGTWGTGRTGTLIVNAPGLTLRDLTIANDFDFIADQPTKATGGSQAVALFIAAGAGTALVERCRILGYQDTLYVRDGRQTFLDCTIVGGTDFIFGGAQARFDRCRIVSRKVLILGALGEGVAGYVAAPSTPAVQPYGLIFNRCRLEREAGLPDATVYLGRPWRAGGNMTLTGQSAFIDCWMDAHIRRDGWTSMGYTNPDRAVNPDRIRTMLTPQEARLSEYRSTGPGAGPASDTRRMLDATAAAAMLAATDIKYRKPHDDAGPKSTMGGK